MGNTNIGFHWERKNYLTKHILKFPDDYVPLMKYIENMQSDASTIFIDREDIINILALDEENCQTKDGTIVLYEMRGENTEVSNFDFSTMKFDGRICSGCILYIDGANELGTVSDISNCVIEALDNQDAVIMFGCNSFGEEQEELFIKILCRYVLNEFGSKSTYDSPDFSNDAQSKDSGYTSEIEVPDIFNKKRGWWK